MCNPTLRASMSRSCANDTPFWQLEIGHTIRSCHIESLVKRRNLKSMKKFHGVNQACMLHFFSSGVRILVNTRFGARCCTVLLKQGQILKMSSDCV